MEGTPSRQDAGTGLASNNVLLVDGDVAWLHASRALRAEEGFKDDSAAGPSEGTRLLSAHRGVQVVPADIETLCLPLAAIVGVSRDSAHRKGTGS